VLAERFLLAVHKLCFKPDCDALSGILDVPNTHRFRELLCRIVDTPDHIRALLELSLAGLHQPLKRSITRGNGHDDAGYALRRYVDQEAVSRLRLGTSLFGMPAAWCRTEGVAEQLRAAASLCSQDIDGWTIGRTSVSPLCVACGARHLVATLLSSPDGVSWRQRCRRGDAEHVVAGDAVSILAVGDSGGLMVDTTIGLQAYDNNTTVLFFSMVGISSSHVAILVTSCSPSPRPMVMSCGGWCPRSFSLFVCSLVSDAPSRCMPATASLGPWTGLAWFTAAPIGGAF